ncbi:MAG: polyprenyl synthetase family protein [Deltaproteobacteria bacterium]|nr:polyprenyl synthetase family protein [Deltaproteobacteria bacterium]
MFFSLSKETEQKIDRLVEKYSGISGFKDTDLWVPGYSFSEGKMIRSFICLEAGEHSENAVICSAVIHMIHSASLVLDDIHDEDTVRRNHPSCWVKNGKNQAMNIGNYLLSSGINLLLDLDTESGKKVQMCEQCVTCIKRMIHGQMLDLKLKGNNLLSRDEYMECAELKTGALFKLSVSLPLILSEVEPEKRIISERVFEKLGIIFQIFDDLLDLKGFKSGRKKFSDLSMERCNFIRVFGDYRMEYPFNDDNSVTKGIEKVVDFIRAEIFQVQEQTEELPLSLRSISNDFISFIVNHGAVA